MTYSARRSGSPARPTRCRPAGRRSRSPSRPTGACRPASHCSERSSRSTPRPGRTRLLHDQLRPPDPLRRRPGRRPWLERIRGLRANASTLQPRGARRGAELDAGDPDELGARYAALRAPFRASRARRLLRHRPPPRRGDRRGDALARPQPDQRPGGRSSSLSSRRGGSSHRCRGGSRSVGASERFALSTGPPAEARTSRWRTAGRGAGSCRRWGSEAAGAERRCQLSSRTKTTPPTTAASRMERATVIAP